MASPDFDPSYSMYQSSYPSPEPSEAPQPSQSGQPPKKKRKAWGQPVPEINPILPPRKRAKTAEEKEQRKNERILRNRRAADKSRQRQKAAVADLEVSKVQIEKENAALRQMVEEYRARYGELEGFSFTAASPASTTPALSVHTDARSEAYSSVATPTSYEDDYTPAVVDTPYISDEPILQETTPSPSLAPTLFPSNDVRIHELSHHPIMMSNLEFTTSGMTQYPAAILCDLQCQPEELNSGLSVGRPSPKFQLFLQFLIQFNLMTTFPVFSASILSPLYHLYQMLQGASPKTSILKDFLNNHFNLIHFLISTPSTTPNSPAIFRTKLLSRLLACSPILARLLLAATDRELQRVVDDASFVEDRQCQAEWASLMTIKWTTTWLEREHARYRLVLEGDNNIDQGRVLEGIDYGAVKRSSWRWKNMEREKHSENAFEMYDYNNASTNGIKVEVH